jgi:precorrin-6A synthase
MDKGETKADLVGLRREICARFIREPGYRFVELPDPPRAKDTDYREAVSDWHAARARIWATAIATELGPDGVGAFLAWGTRRCTTARCASSMPSPPKSTSATTSSRV